MIALGIATGGGNILSYLNTTSVFITVGGAFLATLASNPWSHIRRSFSAIQIAFTRRKTDPIQTILTLLSFSEKARREGLLALEDDLEDVQDKFLQSAIRLVVDGAEPDLIKNIMTTELDSIDRRHESARKVFEDLAALSPAFGMIGTLIGLVVMMKNLGGDASAIGRGMAAALITTLYGSIMANAVFIPIAGKLERDNDMEMMMREMVIEGTLSIQAGDNPRILQQKLASYFPENIRRQINEHIGE